MNSVFRVAYEEWRLLWRNKVALISILLLVLLTSISALTAWNQHQYANAERTRYQLQVNTEFAAQPDRHPHRMVHYGQFAFKPINPLASFDTGIETYTGNTLYLEGHRQNSANFGDVHQSSLIMRFGQLNPSFLLQILAPLLLIFIGHTCVSRERENGTLRLLIIQGLRFKQVVIGKLLVLIGVSLIILLPTLLMFMLIFISTPVSISLLILLITSYSVWLLLWAIIVIAASVIVNSGKDALIILLVLWTTTIILIPRLGSDLVSWSQPLPTRFETDIYISKKLAATGDSHNPNDPHFNEFRKKILKQYSVIRIEDLPVNYKGLLAIEGERLTSALFNQYTEINFTIQKKQLNYINKLSTISPLIALRRISMILSGTDLESYEYFLKQAESHRFKLIQRLNYLQAEKFTYATDKSSRESRINREYWQGISDFKYQAETQTSTLQRALPMVYVLVIWLIVLFGLLLLICRNRRTLLL